jgi:hypothetical protein
MAKGSGGVGKKSGSVSGAKAAVAKAASSLSNLSSAPIETFASEVMKVARGLDEYNNKALVSRVYDAGDFAKRGLTLEQFKQRAMSAHQSDRLELAKNDLGTVSDSKALARSGISPSRGSTTDYVFFRLS